MAIPLLPLLLPLPLPPTSASPATLPIQAEARTIDLTADFEAPPGIAVTLWADTPLVRNPTAMDVDARGRLWVTEAVNYRRWSGRNPGYQREGGDRVVILSDADGDGVAETAITFAQDEELVAPLGICWLGERVLVSCSPDLLVYTDSDGDDVPERREVLLTGWGGRDHDHGLHSFVPGPDGRLYGAVGNAGPHFVTDRGGWTLRSGSLYTGGGAHAAPNAPGLVSDDGEVWVGGLMVRVGASGDGLRVLADNFRNPYEVAVDAFGDLYTADNDDDGNRACRTTWVMEGGDYGFFSQDGARTWQADRRPGQDALRAHWHQDDPGVLPAGTINGGGGPTGVCIVEDGLLGPEWDGAVLNCDAGASAVYVHLPRAEGAGIALEKGLWLRPRDLSQAEGRWFRPSDVCVGPDGAVYVADWWDPGVGGHAMGDREARGRILRLAPPGTPGGAPELELDSVEGALEALSSPAGSVRYLARAALLSHGDAAAPALERELSGAGDARRRARAAWVSAALGAGGRRTLELAFLDRDARVRVAGLRALRAFGLSAEVTRWASVLARDSDAGVRRAAALALAETGSVQPDEFEDLARRHEPGDRWSLHALTTALAALDESSTRPHPLDVPALAAAPVSWDPTTTDLAWWLRPVGLEGAWRARALSAGVLDSERRRAIVALAFTPTRAAAEAMADLALAAQGDLRPLARFFLEHRAENDWNAFDVEIGNGLRGLESAEERWASGVVEAGLVDIDVDVSGATTLFLVVEDGGNGNSHDWADWIEPRISGPAGELSLLELPWDRAEAQWGDVLLGRNAGGGPIAVDGARFEEAIGTHARSEISFQLPAGYRRFRARAGVDDGGTGQAGATTSVRFSVHVELPPDTTRLVALRSVLRDEGAPLDERLEAALALATDPQGGWTVVDLAARDGLPAELRREVGEALRQNPDLAVRALASAHFPLGTEEGAPLPSLNQLVRRRGDARRGRELFFSERAGCSVCHAYGDEGGNVGPELTRVREKLGRRELLDAILNPSAGIAAGYEAEIVETASGLLVTGFVQAEGPVLVVEDTAGRRHAIPEDQVVERTPQTISVMPDDVALGLSPQELSNLASFLEFEPPLWAPAGPAIELFDGESLDGWTAYLEGDAAPEDVWSVEDGVLTCRGTPAGYLRTLRDYESYELTVEWRFPPGGRPGNSGVLLRLTGEDMVWPRSIEAQLQHGNAGDIWNIGEFPMVADAARTSGRHTAKRHASSELTLGEWNTYRIRLAGGELTLEVNGLLQNSASWCEVVSGKIGLQSEGAVIQFRRVSLVPLVVE